MNKKNDSIKCDVTTCQHNLRGRNCNLECIMVSSKCKSGTCCTSFEAEEKKSK